MREAGPPRPVVLTGANGFIGMHLCQAFLNSGYEVTALVRRPGSISISNPKLRVLHYALPENPPPECFTPHPFAFIHCAYQTIGASPERLFRINIHGSERLIAACRTRGVAPFVFISSMSAHPGALSYYGRGKLQIEQSLHLTNDLIIRPGMVVDPSGNGGLYGRLFRTIQRVPVVPIFFGGKQPVQTIDVHDLCSGVVRALDLGLRGRLTLAEPDAIPMNEFYRLIASRAGVRLWLVPLPGNLALMALRCLERSRVGLPVSSENLLGLKAIVREDTRGDLERVGLVVARFQERPGS